MGIEQDAREGRRVAEVATRHGWNGVENSKILSVHIKDELEQLAQFRAMAQRPAHSKEYHIILDSLDRGENIVAACALQEFANRLPSSDFRGIINAFVRRGISLVTS